MSARATRTPTPENGAPARAMHESIPSQFPPARAIPLTQSDPDTPARAIIRTQTDPSTPARAENLDTIRTLGGLLDDLERVRVANGNRIGALERDYGGSLPHLDVIQKQLKVAEHLAELELKRAWRSHYLAEWAKAYRGVGEKSIARLIAIIGDPADRPNVAKLWAYCGHGNPDRKRAKGMSQAELFKLGNPRAKKQVWLIATALLKQRDPRYYEARERYEAREWTDGHKHAAALRWLGKQFLKELWIASRPADNDAHETSAGGDIGAGQHPVDDRWPAACTEGSR